MNKNIILNIPAIGTMFELMIGKTEPCIDGASIETNYHRGINFIACFQSNKFVTFKDCGNGLNYRLQETGFSNAIESFVIDKWLCSFDSFDSLLNSKEYKFTYGISEEEVAAFRKELAEE